MSAKPYERTREMGRIAREGKTGAGEETVWRFAGCPTFRTRPVRDEQRGGWDHTFRVDILVDGRWEDMGEYYWHSPHFDVSRLPGFHPVHLCGMFCDGQDGNGQCDDQKAAGPPAKTPLFEFTEAVWDGL